MKYDIAIIGGGPAGLSAAITASSKGRKVVVFEAHGFSPRLRSVELITDYMGCPDISGSALMDRFVEHACHIGAEIIEEKIISLKEKAGYFELGTPNSKYNADTVILATGISRSSLLPGEKEFLGRGVSYCAKVDGAEYKGKRVAAIATVPDAMEEIEYLADICSEVIFIPRFQGFVAPKRKNVTVILEQPTDITGTDRVTGLHTASEFSVSRPFLCSGLPIRSTAFCRVCRCGDVRFWSMIRLKRASKAFLPAATAPVSRGRSTVRLVRVRRPRSVRSITWPNVMA